MLKILDVLNRYGPSHKVSVIGFAISQGQGLLEREYAAFGHARLGPEERALASVAYDELRARGLIRPTFGGGAQDFDLHCELSERGREMLSRGILDDLDEELLKLGPDLVELRDGAHESAARGGPDALRHASVSCRELLREVLELLAPASEVRAQPWFEQDRDADPGEVTRRQRARLALQSRGVEDWEAIADEIVSAINLLSRPTHFVGTSAIRAADLVGRADFALKVLLL